MTTLLDGSRGTALDDDVDLVRDRVLVERAQAGDRSAFDDLYLRYYRRLYRFCIRRLQDAHEAEDVTQESFARAWRALPSFAGDRRFYPWLSVIASHLCTDVVRRRSRSTPVAEFHQAEMASTDDSGEELMVAAVDSDLVARAFLRLSTRHQRILRLREGSGWSYQMIADHEGVGITAIETLLWRARQALKREFAALADLDGRFVGAVGGLLGVRAIRRLLASHLSSARRLVQSHPWPTAALGSAAAASVALLAVAAPGSMTVGTAPTRSAPPAISRSSTPDAWSVVGEQTAARLAPEAQRPLAGEPLLAGHGSDTGTSLPASRDTVGALAPYLDLDPYLDLGPAGSLASLGGLADLGSLGALDAEGPTGTVLQDAAGTTRALTSTASSLVGSAGTRLSATLATDKPVITSLTTSLGTAASAPLGTAASASEVGAGSAACDIRASVGSVTSMLRSLTSGSPSNTSTGTSCPR